MCVCVCVCVCVCACVWLKNRTGAPWTCETHLRLEGLMVSIIPMKQSKSYWKYHQVSTAVPMYIQFSWLP